MKAKFAVAAAVIALVAVVASPAGAAPNKRVTGTFTGTSSFTLGGGCFVRVHDSATIVTGKRATATLDIDQCVDLDVSNNTFVGSGTFRITTDKGEVTGTSIGPPSPTNVVNPVPLNLYLTVVTADRGLAVRGSTLHLTGTWISNGVDGGPITGTIT